MKFTVVQLFEKEVNKGYVNGPFQSISLPVFCTRPIDIATRKYSGKKRFIFELSPRSCPFPSINSLIPPEPFSLHSATVDNDSELIQTEAQGMWLSKAVVQDLCHCHSLPCGGVSIGNANASQSYVIIEATLNQRKSCPS